MSQPKDSQAPDDAMLYEFDEWSPEKAAQDAALIRRMSGGTMKLNDGENIVRFLPGPKGSGGPFVVTHQHYIKLGGMEDAVSFNCPRAMANQPCPACQTADRLQATGNKADYDAAKEFLPKLRVYAVAIDRFNEALGPQVFAFGKLINDDVNTFRAKYGDPSHPYNGYDINIDKSGSGQQTKYKVLPSMDRTPLGDMTWLHPDTRPSLARYLQVPTYDEANAELRAVPMPSMAAPRSGGVAPGASRTLPQSASAARPPAMPAARTAPSARVAAPAQPVPRPQPRPMPAQSAPAQPSGSITGDVNDDGDPMPPGDDVPF